MNLFKKIKPMNPVLNELVEFSNEAGLTNFYSVNINQGYSKPIVIHCQGKRSPKLIEKLQNMGFEFTERRDTDYCLDGKPTLQCKYYRTVLYLT